MALTRPDPDRRVFCAGKFNATTLSWADVSTGAAYETTARVYEDQLTAVFEQKWVTAANGTSVGNTDAVLSSWPMFGMPNSETITGWST